MSPITLVISLIGHLFVFKNKFDQLLNVPLREHRAASRRYGERHQRCPALNHMCNQSKLTARRQVR